MKLIMIKHLPGRHDQATHGRGWNGGQGRRRDGRGRFTNGATPTPIAVNDRVQLPDGSGGRVVTELPDGSLAVLRDDGMAAIHRRDELENSRDVERRTEAERRRAETTVPVRDKAQPRRTDIGDWMDQGEAIGSWNTSTRSDRGDHRLEYIWRTQGFDGLPRTASDEELDEEIRAGGLELWRGLTPTGNSTDVARNYAEQFRTGEPFPGLGIYGNGTYASPMRKMANQFATSGGQGVVMRIVLRRDARTIDSDSLYDLAQSLQNQLDGADTNVKYAAQDMGRLASMLGYDAILEGDPGAPPREVVILNRTAISVSPILREPS